MFCETKETHLKIFVLAALGWQLLYKKQGTTIYKEQKELYASNLIIYYYIIKAYNKTLQCKATVEVSNKLSYFS